MIAYIKFSGRHKGGSIRDGVILSVQIVKQYPARPMTVGILRGPVK